jgi:hypothetical protein
MGKKMLHCAACGRTAGPDMIACPHRASGGCPFTLEEGAAHSSCVGTVMMVFSLPFMGLPLVAITQETALLPCVSVFVLAGLGLFLYGLYNLLAYATTLTNPQDGTYWHSVTLLNWTVRQEMVTHFTPVDLDLPPLPPLDYPLSVASLCSPTSRFERAVFIFNSTLLALIAQGVLSLHYAAEYQARWGSSWHRVEGSAAYRIRLESAGQRVPGVLEDRLVQAVRQAGPSGATIYRAVYHLYEQDMPNPFGHFMGWVQRDAVRRSLGESKLLGRFDFTRQGRAALDGDYATLCTLHDAANARYPGLLGGFGQEVRRAISARTEDSDPV